VGIQVDPVASLLLALDRRLAVVEVVVSEVREALVHHPFEKE
jgi:hypothetical protein